MDETNLATTEYTQDGVSAESSDLYYYYYHYDTLSFGNLDGVLSHHTVHTRQDPEFLRRFLLVEELQYDDTLTESSSGTSAASTEDSDGGTEVHEEGGQCRRSLGGAHLSV